jgi:tetratricopeptide (TPR) repeat protein
MSFYGSLQATVDKKYRSGIENCRKALGTLKKKGVKDEAFYPVFYFNLGKAYLAASKKKEAIEAFNSGLKYDPRNRDIQKELQHIGYRKKPPVPFLDRSNPINKYIGKLVSKKSGKNTGRGSA